MRVETSQAVPDIDFTTPDLLPYGIIVVDREGVILYYNAREEQIACRKKEEVTGRNFFKDVAPCTQVQIFYGRFIDVMQSLDASAQFHFTFPFSEHPREVEITLTSFMHQDALLCLIAVNDVTEETQVRERILRAERLREVGEVAASVAHNFNNIMTAVKGHADLLMLRGSLNEQARQSVECILQAAGDGIEMVKRIKANSLQQPAATHTATVSLNAIVNDSLAMTAAYLQQARETLNKDITVETDLSVSAPPVRANAGELREVAINLLRNAVDAIDGRGCITLKTAVEGSYSVLQVSDTGMGMSREVQDRLFHPLFTTKGTQGTGLGLSSSYAIIQRHQGHIGVVSEPGKGTVFTISLPLEACPANSSAPPLHAQSK